MYFFLAFLFFLIGLLSSLYSYWFLSFLPLLLFYLYRFKNLKLSSFFFLLFTLIGLLSVLLVLKGKEGNIDINGIVVSSKENYILLLTRQGTYYLYSKGNNLPLFSILCIQGKSESLSFSHYESGFSFEDYLNHHAVFYSIAVKKEEVIFRPFDLVGTCENRIFRYLEKESRTIVSALLFNTSAKDIPSSLTRLNLFSVFSVSGLHLSFLFQAMEKTIPKPLRKHIGVIETLITLTLLFLSGFRYTLRRIFLLRVLKDLSPHLKRRLSYLERISIVCMVMLIFEPYSLFLPSFYCSFPLLFFLALTNNRRKKKKPTDFITFFLLIFSFSLMTTLEEKGGFYLLSPFFQLLILPLSHLSFLLSLFLFPFPIVGKPIQILIRCILFLSDTSESLPFFIVTGKPPLIYLILFYLVFLFCPILAKYSYRKESQKLGFLLSLSLVIISFPSTLPKYELDIIDVDQGSSTLIRNKTDDILIDTGGLLKVDLATESLIPYFHKKKIHSLTAVILTHHDYDHYGALESLVKNFPVKTVYWQTDFLSEKDNSQLIGNTVIENLNDYRIDTDENSTSGVYRLSVKGKRILIMGDAPKEVEARLIQDRKRDIETDYLVIGHHGSDTSSSIEFLKATKAKKAFISCGENNRYGFPHQKTIQNLKAAGLLYERTDEKGTIEVRL